MAKLSLRGKDLIAIGFPEGPAVGMAINMMTKHYKRHSQEAALEVLKELLANPEAYREDPVLGPIAKKLILPKSGKPEPIELRAEPLPFPVYGESFIEAEALEQMRMAMRLPVTHSGALMPDAHSGYGLPIGGVVALENAVMPYGVGMDIGCRMCLTIYDIPTKYLEGQKDRLKKILEENTRFGIDTFSDPVDDPVLDRPEFREIPVLRALRQKAVNQIGTSGFGNHFVEFGIVTIEQEDNGLGLPPGTFIGLLSHSGSRGMGAGIAKHYTTLAMEVCPLPRKAQHLAWLDLDSELGREYWQAMTLAGDYASANHHDIHRRLGKKLGEKPLVMVENHHNFAWKEVLEDGKIHVVHRKGATPAGKGVLGIIPGSMTAPAFIVRGKGNPDSLNSASHGAGRQMSRTTALKSFTHSQLKKHLQEKGVELIGGGLDESPFAYKNIGQVMDFQRDLVETLGTFTPKIVRMDADSSRKKRDEAD